MLPDDDPVLPGDDGEEEGLVALPLLLFEPDDPALPSPPRWHAATLTPMRVARSRTLQVDCLRMMTLQIGRAHV